MPRATISEAALAELKNRNPVDELAARYVKLRRQGRMMVGPCPICSPDPLKRDSTRFECDADHWVCAVCSDGGDVIRLVQRIENLDFLRAVEWLGGVRELDHTQLARHEAERQQRRIERDQQASHFREKERRSLFEIWRRALEVPVTPVEDYLKLRKLKLPPGARLRAAPDMPLHAGWPDRASVLHRGWAMLGAITGRDGRFCGLLITWIDLDQPNGKARVVDPATGRMLPSKKVRGSKAGGTIEILPAPVPQQLILGEGIETVASVWLALATVGRDLSNTAFWSSVDLGNMGGRALETVPHPTLKMAHNRPQHVAGPEPDLSQPGIAIPDSVSDVVLLGDGDSDRFITHCALARAATRFAQQGRTVRVAWAPPGRDFNDVLRGAA